MTHDKSLREMAEEMARALFYRILDSDQKDVVTIAETLEPLIAEIQAARKFMDILQMPRGAERRLLRYAAHLEYNAIRKKNEGGE